MVVFGRFFKCPKVEKSAQFVQKNPENRRKFGQIGRFFPLLDNLKKRPKPDFQNGFLAYP
jgi:hypothetical protein